MRLVLLAIFAVVLTAVAIAWQEDEAMDKKIRHAFQNLPKATEMVIRYHEIRGLQSQYQWHIDGTMWWVRLHRHDGPMMKQLDKKKKYRVKGIIVDQNYGVIEVWLQQYAEVE